jgi:hypothetical protein
MFLLCGKINALLCKSICERLRKKEKMKEFRKMEVVVMVMMMMMMMMIMMMMVMILSITVIKQQNILSSNKRFVFRECVLRNNSQCFCLAFFPRTYKT